MNQAREFILNQLQYRKRIEQKPYEEICSLASKLSDRIYTLEGENNRLSSDLLSLQRILLAEGTESAKEMFSLLTKDPSSTRPSDKRISELQEKLTNALKEKAEDDQTIADLRNKLNEKNSLIAQLTASLNERNKEVLGLKKAIDNLKDENLALLLSNKSLEKQNHKLSIDCDSLCKEVLTIKRDNADRLNAENEKEQQERIRKELEGNIVEINRKHSAKLASGDPVAKAIENLDDLALDERTVSQVPTKVKITFDAHEGETCAIHWYSMDSPHDHYLATGGGCDRKVRIWKVEEDESKSMFTLHGSNASINSIDVEDDCILAASNDMATRIWTLKDRRFRVTLTGHSGKVMAAKFIGHPTRAASCSADRTVKIWDTNTAGCIGTYFAGSSCHDLVYADRQVITGHFDGVVRCWDLSKSGYDSAGEIKLQSKVTSLDMYKDSSRLICSLRDNTIKSVDLRRMEVLQTYFDERFRVGSDTTRAKYSSDGRYIACGSADGSLFVWDTNTTKLEKILTGSNSAILACCWSPEGDRIASIERGKKVSIWA